MPDSLVGGFGRVDGVPGGIGGGGHVLVLRVSVGVPST